MPSSVVVLGPFVGGLNKASDASAIGDEELSEAINVNVDLDGSLVCRPPISQVAYGPATIDNNLPIASRINIIGNANINGIPYLIACAAAGVFALRVHSIPSTGVEWFEYIKISETVQSDCAIQLHNIVYILATPQSPSNGGVWDGTTFTVDGTSVRGSAAIFFKGRVFVAPGAFQTAHPQSSQLVFSDPVPLTIPVAVPWNAVNLIPVGQGDGENLIDMAVVADNLMLFKNNSTYSYIYDVSPNEGILREVNRNIGVSAQFCVVTHENEVYVFHEGNVFQISNYNFVEASIKVPFSPPAFEDTRREKVCMSLLGDTILVRYFDDLYALNLLTKTWSQWESANSTLNSIGRITKLETNLITGKLEGYYGGSVLTNTKSLMRIKVSHTSEDSEYTLSGEGDLGSLDVIKVPHAIECTLITKIFDFATPHLFKRLMWWGVDLISDGHIVGIADPVVQTGPVTWNDLTSVTWDELYAWNSLLQDVGYTETDVEDPYVIRRKFIKLLKSLRFRQIQFTVEFFSNGQISSEQTLGPARVFTLSAIVGAKQTVPKQVN